MPPKPHAPPEDRRTLLRPDWPASAAFGGFLGAMVVFTLLEKEGHSIGEILTPPYVWQVIVVVASSAVVGIFAFEIMHRLLKRFMSS